jgi:hypothetical protein
MVFSRSPVLSNLVHQAASQADASAQSLQTISLEINNKWVRPDSFYMAVQRLYGLPLLHGPPQRTSVDVNDYAAAGSTLERFRFALSYAAAGHSIGWGPVVRRGIEVATGLLSLETVEEALEFALTDYRDRGSHDEFTYGDGSRLLLDNIVGLVANKLSPTFRLDTSAADAKSYSRLPYDVPSPAVTSTAPEPESPVIARGHNATYLGKAFRSQNHPNIQFGDLSLSNGVNGTAAETPKASQPANLTAHTILSHILINLPFTSLKMLLESGYSHMNGWASVEIRYRAVQDAINEREARRRRAIDAVTHGKVPDARTIQAGLQSPEPRHIGRWSVLGWKENIITRSDIDYASLQRQWIPLRDVQPGPVAAYP